MRRRPRKRRCTVYTRIAVQMASLKSPAARRSPDTTAHESAHELTSSSVLEELAPNTQEADSQIPLPTWPILSSMQVCPSPKLAHQCHPPRSMRHHRVDHYSHCHQRQTQRSIYLGMCVFGIFIGAIIPHIICFISPYTLRYPCHHKPTIHHRPIHPLRITTSLALPGHTQTYMGIQCGARRHVHHHRFHPHRGTTLFSRPQR